ncbi:MAG: hypothetical protein KF744_07225 [Taibaiella sp.]|nr:hypothetical protein [Taibaiella sp.]
MSVAELKKEAIRQFALRVESTDNENVLEMILDFLKGIKTNDDNAVNLSQHYDAIKSKYCSVLKKLAE